MNETPIGRRDGRSKRPYAGATRIVVFGTALALLFAAALPLGAAPANDYPTAARAEYVFACMASNDQTSEVLRRCSCSIDVIASLIPYERYVQAETVMRMRRIGGERTAVFRDAPWMDTVIEELKQAQVEADIRCF